MARAAHVRGIDPASPLRPGCVPAAGAALACVPLPDRSPRRHGDPLMSQTVLVVEDNPITRKFVRLALASDGFEVIAP
jgi:hypothetical protein